MNRLMREAGLVKLKVLENTKAQSSQLKLFSHLFYLVKNLKEILALIKKYDFICLFLLLSIKHKISTQKPCYKKQT